nr:hypothetical protein [Actinomycetota bacterium]
MRIVVAGLTLAIAGMAASPGSEPTRGDIEVRRDVVYREVDNTELRLDAYLPPGGGVHPAVVLIHGGGWVIGAKGAFESFARQL